MNFILQIRMALSCVCVCVPLLSYSASIQKVDAVVLGGGAAGLTSAIYLGRAGFSSFVLEGPIPGGAITQSNHVYNWPGYKEISGLDLMEHIRAQAEASGATLLREEIVAIDLSQRPFSITSQDIYDTSKKRTILADTCIIALGANAKKLEVPGESMYFSKGVYTCAVCDGSLYKNKTVAVVGGGDGALVEAEYLSSIAKKVYLLNRKAKFKGIEKSRQERLIQLPNVEIVYNVSVKEIKGDGQVVDSITLINKEGKEESLKIDALFLAIGATPNTQFFAKQLELDEQGYIVLKKKTETSLPGVFAAGDIADPVFKQAVIASGEGAKAAMQASDYLHAMSFKKSEDVPAISKVLEVSSLSELKEIVSKNKQLVLVDFYATWCGPCRYLGKFIDGWAQDLQGKAILCKVNVDVAGEIASRYQVRSMPTVVVINPEGQEIARKVGVEEIIRYVDRLKK